MCVLVNSTITFSKPNISFDQPNTTCCLGVSFLSTEIVIYKAEVKKTLTIEVWSKAENIISAFIFIPETIIPDPRHCVLSSAGLPGLGDGVLHRAVTEPAGVTPVQPWPPGVIELVKGGDNRILVPTCSLSLMVVQVVTTQPWRVGEYNTWSGRKRVSYWTAKQPKKGKQHLQLPGEIKVNSMCVRLISCFTSVEKHRTVSTSGIRFEKGIGLPPCLAGSSSRNLSPFPMGTVPGLHIAPICSFAVPTVISPLSALRVLKGEQSWLKFCNYIFLIRKFIIWDQFIMRAMSRLEKK